jgi:hypothetical protein
MYQYFLPWKSFNVSLKSVETWMRANVSYYQGNSADLQFNLWFSEEPDEATKQYIQDYWNDLTEESTEATSYVSASSIVAAVQAAREDMVAKSWDQLSTAQKKLLAGLTPTREDLGL